MKKLKMLYRYVIVCCLFVLVASLSVGKNVSAATNKKVSVGKAYTVKTKKGTTVKYTFTIKEKMEVQLFFKLKGKAKASKDAVVISLKDKDGKKKLSDYRILPKQSYEGAFVLEKGSYTVEAIANATGYKTKLKLTDVTKGPSKVTLQKKVTIRAGFSQSLTWKVVEPAAGYVAMDKVKWTSSNEKVAKVDATGRVTAVAKGKATITLKLTNGKAYTCVVKVPKKSIDDCILQDKVAVAVKEVTKSGKRINAKLMFVNRNKKKALKKVTFTILQYDAKGKRIKSGDSVYAVNYLTKKVPANTYAVYSYRVNPKAMYIRVCVKNVTLSKTKKKWKSKYYTKWQKAYKKEYSAK